MNASNKGILYETKTALCSTVHEGEEIRRMNAANKGILYETKTALYISYY